MDSTRFDAVARSLSRTRTRRAMLTALLAGSFAGFGAASADGACPEGKTRCGRKCRDLNSDPDHCGLCGRRCQFNGICEQGQCGCVLGCPAADLQLGFTCCPASSGGGVCGCTGVGGPAFLDPRTCGAIPAAKCPPKRRCIGPNCQACCPAGTTCDPTTGACLR